MSSLEYCRICRTIRPFADLTGTSGAPDFRCCTHCGDGYCTTPETPPTLEAS
jgi:hypothetical protein